MSGQKCKKGARSAVAFPPSAGVMIDESSEEPNHHSLQLTPPRYLTRYLTFTLSISLAAGVPCFELHTAESSAYSMIRYLQTGLHG